MNIVELHERVQFWIDTVGSTRFEAEDIDKALNIAIDNKVTESYGHNRILNYSDAIQKTQKIRDELGNIIKLATNGSGITISGNTITISSTIKYRHLLMLEVNISGYGLIGANPISYDELKVISKNPFRKAKTGIFAKVYYNELEGNIVITHDFSGSLSNANLYYLSNPDAVFFGYEVDNTYTFPTTKTVIASSQTVLDGITYEIGRTISIATGKKITSGSVVYGYIDINLRESIHEEIAIRAAVNCLLTAGQNDKANSLIKQIMAP